MRPVQVVLTDREIDLVDKMVDAGYSKSRADFVRKATLEYCLRHGENSDGIGK